MEDPVIHFLTTSFTFSRPHPLPTNCSVTIELEVEMLANIGSPENRISRTSTDQIRSKSQKAAIPCFILHSKHCSIDPNLLPDNLSSADQPPPPIPDRRKKAALLGQDVLDDHSHPPADDSETSAASSGLNKIKKLLDPIRNKLSSNNDGTKTKSDSVPIYSLNEADLDQINQKHSEETNIKTDLEDDLGFEIIDLPPHSSHFTFEGQLQDESPSSPLAIPALKVLGNPMESAAFPEPTIPPSSQKQPHRPVPSTPDSVPTIDSDQKNPVSSSDLVIILHFHGGGFVSQSPKTHLNYLQMWASKTQLPLISVNYCPSSPLFLTFSQDLSLEFLSPLKICFSNISPTDPERKCSSQPRSTLSSGIR